MPNAATAYLALARVVDLHSGETVLVHGALGGLASTFPGVARSLGASTVAGTVRSASLATAEASGLPYDRVIASDAFPGALIDERFDVVIDPVGGGLRTASLDVMAPLGRLLAVGNASGDWQHTVETNRLWVSNLATLGFSGFSRGGGTGRSAVELRQAPDNPPAPGRIPPTRWDSPSAPIPARVARAPNGPRANSWIEVIDACHPFN